MVDVMLVNFHIMDSKKVFFAEWCYGCTQFNFHTPDAGTNCSDNVMLQFLTRASGRTTSSTYLSLSALRVLIVQANASVRGLAEVLIFKVWTCFTILCLDDFCRGGYLSYNSRVTRVLHFLSTLRVALIIQLSSIQSRVFIQ